MQQFKSFSYVAPCELSRSASSPNISASAFPSLHSPRTGFHLQHLQLSRSPRHSPQLSPRLSSSPSLMFSSSPRSFTSSSPRNLKSSGMFKVVKSPAFYDLVFPSPPSPLSLPTSPLPLLYLFHFLLLLLIILFSHSMLRNRRSSNPSHPSLPLQQSYISLSTGDEICITIYLLYNISFKMKLEIHTYIYILYIMFLKTRKGKRSREVVGCCNAWYCVVLRGAACRVRTACDACIACAAQPA